jgi:ketopantoate reductase
VAVVETGRLNQNLRDRKIALFIFRAKSNRLTDLLPHIAACNAILATIKPGICVQLWDTEAVAHTIKPILQPQTAVTSLQNRR